MRVAVISDIHSNLHALEMVERQIERDGAEEVWNLGDSVGYGPKPNECCALLARLAAVSLIGNHDLAALGKLSLDDFSPLAAGAARWTQERLDQGSRAYLSPLEPSARASECALYHGSPREPVWAYVLGPSSAADAFALSDDRLLLVGHSHVAMAASLPPDEGDGFFQEARDGSSFDISGGRWLLNPGSVGQPRDGDPRAAYLLLDLERGQAEFRRAEYDVAATQAEIRAAGLSEQLAARLPLGL